MSQSRFSTEKQETLYKFIASSLRFLQEKEDLLDQLVLDEMGKKLVQATLQTTSKMIGYFRRYLYISIWSDDQRSKDTLSAYLRTAEYVKHHLQAALDKRNPSVQSVYYYLLNSEREDNRKHDYLRELSLKENGNVLLHLIKDYAEKRRQALQTIFGANAAYFETDQLDSYPASKLSAHDVCELLKAFLGENKAAKHHATHFHKAGKYGKNKSTFRHQNRHKL